MSVSIKTTDRLGVLEIVGNAVIGGMESYVAQLTRQLPASRFRVFCLCPFESGLTAELRRAGAEVYIAPIADDPSWETIQVASTLIRTHRLQVIHAHLPNAHLLANLVSSITGIPALATLHGGRLSLLEFEIMRLGASHLSVVCQSARLHCIGLGISPNRIHLIPNGVDYDFFAALHSPPFFRDELGLKASTPLIGYVGRLSPEKAPDDFIRTAQQVHLQLPKAHFVLVGEGPMLAELKQLTARAGLQNRIHFAGIQRRMRSVYQSLDLLVSSSKSEGMPFVLMEAMASGLATVATQVGGVPEIVEVGATGLLAPPNDPKLLAEAVVKLMQDPEMRHTMGRAAQERVRAQFSLANSVQKTAALLESLAEQDTHGSSLTTSVAPLFAGSARPG